jgi:exodeoxyribonuclease VII large subunit
MITTERKIYSVAQINNLARQLLEGQLGKRWISGEISNLSPASSGHVYFNLKDASACIRCALFRQNGRQLNFALKNGLQVLVLGQVSLYETRGDYQLIAQTIELSGDGLLQKAFAELKKRLS